METYVYGASQPERRRDDASHFLGTDPSAYGGPMQPPHLAQDASERPGRIYPSTRQPAPRPGRSLEQSAGT